MIQKIINSETKEVKAQNDAVLVAFSVKENEAISIPDNWRKKIQNFENDLNF